MWKHQSPPLGIRLERKAASESRDDLESFFKHSSSQQVKARDGTNTAEGHGGDGGERAVSAAFGSGAGKERFEREKSDSAVTFKHDFDDDHTHEANQGWEHTEM